MASKYSFPFFFSLLILLVSQTVCEEYYRLSKIHPRPYCRLDKLRSIKNTTSVTVIEVNKVIKALREYSGSYEILSTILERNLRSFQPYCEESMLFFVDRQNRFTIYGNNNTVTLFVPPDEAIRFEEWIDLEYQILMSKVDQEAFKTGSLSKCSKLAPCSPTKQWLIVDRVFDNGTVFINNVKIKHWNIYNDGHVIVHGTEDFFNPNLGETKVSSYFW